MHFVPINKISVNDVIIKPIYDERGILLLNSNIPLTKTNIEKIKQLGYQGLYIYDNLSKFDEFKEVIDEQQRREAIKSLKILNLDAVAYFANTIVNSLINRNNMCVELQELSNYDDFLYQHSINVAILSATIGIGYGFNNEQLKNITLAALLHDIGKNEIDKKILDKPSKLTLEEYEIIKNHSKLGYEALKNKESISSTIKVAVLEHHENEDGTGYPRNIKGENIHIFAKIIHVADVYDALISKRVYKKAYEPSEAIEYLMSNIGIMFDMNVVLTFIKYIAIYPVGTMVMLSSGEKAQVVKNNDNMPLRPVVALLKNEKLIDLLNDEESYSVTIISSGIERIQEKIKELEKQKIINEAEKKEYQKVIDKIN